MYKAEVVVKNEVGLHARPASLFTKEAAKYKSEIKLIKDKNEYNGKSILSVLSMGAVKGDAIAIVADGADERDAVNALKALVETGLDR